MPALPTHNVPAPAPSPGLTAERGALQIFLAVLTRVCIISVINNSVGIIFFAVAGSRLQAMLSMAQAAFYLIAFCLLKRQRILPAVAIMLGATVINAALGTLLDGWDSGYCYYLLLIIPTIINSLPRAPALGVLGILFSLYLGLLLIMQTLPPLQPIGHIPLVVLEAFNDGAVFVMMVYFTFINKLVQSDSEQKLKLLATTDPLTGLFNRRYAIEVIVREARLVERADRPLSFILADIDHFKAINDRYGHEGGDAVLVAVSKALAGITRTENILSRWGGEEFLLVLPATSREGAASLAARVNQLMQELRLKLGEDEVGVSLTMGIASVDAGESWTAALARADRALYEGKRSGRNCVRLDRDLAVAPPPEAKLHSYPGCSQAA